MKANRYSMMIGKKRQSDQKAKPNMKKNKKF